MQGVAQDPEGEDRLGLLARGGVPAWIGSPAKNVIGHMIEVPDDRDYDGESILQVLDGTGTREGREFLYYDGANLQCYRNGDWKLKLPFRGFHGSNGKKGVLPHDTLLFNLKSDPGEQVNLYADQPEKVAEMVSFMDAYKESKGELPLSLVIGDPADHSHYRYLIGKYGPDYNRIEW